MGPPPRMRPVPPVRPEHAGRLPLWERLAFAVVLAIMVVFVVVLTISAARAHERRPGGPATGAAAQRGRAAGTMTPGQPAQALERGRPGRTAQAAGRARRAGRAGAVGRVARVGRVGAGGSGGSGALRAKWDRRLATALAPVRHAQTGDLAVGVSDLSTGVTAVYGAGSASTPPAS